MLLPVLLMTACLFCCNAELDPAVSALISKVQQLNESLDIVGSFESFGEDSREVFRLGQPVGEMLMEALNSEAINDTSTLIELHKLFQVPGGGCLWRPFLRKDRVFKSMHNLTNVNLIPSDRESLIVTIKEDLYDIFVDPHFLLTPHFFTAFYNIHEPVTIYMRVKTKALHEKMSLEELASFYRDLRRVRTDLLRLVLVKSMIGNITYPSNPSGYFITPPHDYNEVEPTAKALMNTGREIADWAQRIQESWPEIGIQTARDAIGNETGRYVNETAKIVQNALKKQGSKKYTHQVLVEPTDPMNNSNLANFTNFDIYITRIYGTETNEIVVKVNSANEKLKSSIIFHPFLIIYLLFYCIH